MSHPQHPQRPVFRFRNSFRMILPKGKHTSSELLSTFENTLAGRIEKLQPVSDVDALQLHWLRCAMEQLREVHKDVKTLITDLGLPTNDRKSKWIEMHLERSGKLLDISNSFTSQIRELQEGHHYLLSALCCSGGTIPETYIHACSSLDKWRQHVNSSNPSLDQCFSSMDGLSQSLDLPKGRNSKEKALIRAMYGVKVLTFFVCGVFAASFSGSAKKLKDLQVPDQYLWAKAFAVLQTCVNARIRKVFTSGRVIVLKELQAIDASVEKLYTIVREGVPVEAEVLMNATSDIKKSYEEYSQSLSLLLKEVENFFTVLLAQRNSWLLTQ